MQNFMFDTNIFNHVLDGGVDVAPFVGKAHFLITHVQVDELSKTSDPCRKTSLLAVFESVPQKTVPTKTFVLGTSKLDRAEVGEGTLYAKMKSELDQLNKSKPNNVKDALVAETAVKNEFTLVTDDVDLSQVTKHNGGFCLNLTEFLTAL
jgi:rRNA-processing protein FCF1